MLKFSHAVTEIHNSGARYHKSHAIYWRFLGFQRIMSLNVSINARFASSKLPKQGTKH